MLSLLLQVPPTVESASVILLLTHTDDGPVIESGPMLLTVSGVVNEQPDVVV